MNYVDYDFESLWFDIYQKVIKQNNRLNGSGLDKSQLREVATSIFIAKTQKGIVRPEVEESKTVEVPEQFEHMQQPSASAAPASVPSGFIATEGQLKTIRKLLKDSRINSKERARIESILAQEEVSKSTASDILTYFFGQRIKQNGQWVRISHGVLKDRTQPQPA